MYPFDDFIMILSIRETLCLQTPALWTLQAVLIKIILFNFVLINKRRKFSNTGCPADGEVTPLMLAWLFKLEVDTLKQPLLCIKIFAGMLF